MLAHCTRRWTSLSSSLVNVSCLLGCLFPSPPPPRHTPTTHIQILNKSKSIHASEFFKSLVVVSYLCLGQITCARVPVGSMCAALWWVKGQIVICKGPFHPSMCTRHLASAGLIYVIFLSPESTDNWPSLAVYEANFRHWTMWPQQSAWHIYQVVYSPVGRLLKLWANDAPASGRRFLWGGHKLAHIPANTRSWISVGLALVQRRRRWTSAKPTSIQRLVSAAYMCHHHTEFAHQVALRGRVRWKGVAGKVMRKREQITNTEHFK